MRIIIAAILFICFMASCRKDRVKAGEKVEMYLLKNPSLAVGRCEIDSIGLTLPDEPFLRNEDILGYSRSNHEFTLTRDAYERIIKTPGRSPFAVTVDKKVVYYAFHMPPIMSSTCSNAIIMTQSWKTANAIEMKISYVDPSAVQPIADDRNSDRLLATLVRQGKLFQ